MTDLLYIDEWKKLVKEFVSQTINAILNNRLTDTTIKTKKNYNDKRHTFSLSLSKDNASTKMFFYDDNDDNQTNKYTDKYNSIDYLYLGESSFLLPKYKQIIDLNKELNNFYIDSVKEFKNFSLNIFFNRDNKSFKVESWIINVFCKLLDNQSIRRQYFVKKIKTLYRTINSLFRISPLFTFFKKAKVFGYTLDFEIHFLKEHELDNINTYGNVYSIPKYIDKFGSIEIQMFYYNKQQILSIEEDNVNKFKYLYIILHANMLKYYYKS